MTSTHDPTTVNIKELFPAHSRKIDILEQRFSGSSALSNDAADGDRPLDEPSMDGEEVILLDDEGEPEEEQHATPQQPTRTLPRGALPHDLEDRDHDGKDGKDHRDQDDKDSKDHRDQDDKDGKGPGDRQARRDSSHKYRRFSQEEDRKIKEGYAKFGNKWEEIARWAHLDRSSSQISSRFTRIGKSGSSVTGSPAISSSAAAKEDPDKLGTNSVLLNRVTEAEDQPPTKQRRIDSDRRDSGNVKPEPTVPSVAASPASHPAADGATVATSHSLSPARNGTPSGVETNATPTKLGLVGSEAKPDTDPWKGERERISVAEQTLKGRESQLAEWESRLKDWEWKLQQKASEEHKKSTELICDLLVGRARAERALARKKLAEDCARFGQSSYERRGMEMIEMWQDGEAFKQLEEQLRALTKSRETLETKKKQLAKARQSASKSIVADGVAEEEILKVRIMAIKREEVVLQEERDRLLAPKLLHMKELRRANDEDQSPLSDFRRLNDRYLLLSLLGKGGFSEVYLAFDLKEHRQVACKIHSVNTMWSVTKRQNYTKHAIREYKIHKELVHDKVVKLFDVFEIDSSSFCTVLEYCEGGDLDSYLKQNKILSEREAKCIIAQIFSGLKYLSSQKRPIIHYDLKPGNIIFQTNGEVKITDFGLSKIMEEDSEFVELTSQGAGTYWYLPPECFEMGGKHPPMISSKVDVWSVGVIFYQLLYGKKPFGNEMSQQKFLSENVAAQTTRVEFPSKPVVSKEAKDFLQKCLTHNQMLRPDVQSCCADPFLSQMRSGGKKTAPVAPASSNPQMPPPKGNAKRKIDTSE